MFSDVLKDRINFEKDFGFIHSTFGEVSGSLLSILHSGKSYVFEIATEDISDAISMIGKDYPNEVIIRYNNKEEIFKLAVESCKLYKENDIFILSIEGSHDE